MLFLIEFLRIKDWWFILKFTPHLKGLIYIYTHIWVYISSGNDIIHIALQESMCVLCRLVGFTFAFHL